MKLMKAIVYETYGPPEVLHVKSIPVPTIEEDDILINVKAVEATKSDCELRSFKFPVKWFVLPLRIFFGIRKPKKQVLGSYFAGEVTEVGANVTKFKPGDQIYGIATLKMGAYAEYLRLPAKYPLTAKPNNLSFAEAATVPLGGLNAIHFMRKANIKAGEKVLVIGAGGSIGIFGVQIAKAMGAEVTAVDSAIKEEMLREIGSDHFIDYTKEDFAASGEKYDVIFNMIAPTSFTKCINTLKPNGRYITANPKLSDMIRAQLNNRSGDKKAIFAFAGETEEELIALREMIEAGQISPTIDKILPMEQAAEAHTRVQTEQRIGMVVISMDDSTIASE